MQEGGVVIDEITTIISNSKDGVNKSTMVSYWGKIFQELYMNSFSNSFKPQREWEIELLEMTWKKFKSNANELSKKCWSIGEDLPYLKMLQIFWNHVIFYII